MYRSACKAARQECDHYRQIVPFILKRQLYDWEVSLGRKTLPKREPVPQIESAPVKALVDRAAKNLEAH